MKKTFRIIESKKVKLKINEDFQKEHKKIMEEIDNINNRKFEMKPLVQSYLQIFIKPDYYYINKINRILNCFQEKIVKPHKEEKKKITEKIKIIRKRSK
jgi:hypothetical protein